MEQYSKHILSIEERKILLTEWAKNGDGKAIEMLNKMDGVYREKKQLELTGDIKTDNKWTIEFIEAKNEQSSDTEQTK